MSHPPEGGKSRSFARRIFYRLFWIIVAFGSGAGFTFYHKQTIFLWLLAPADGKLSPFEDGLPVYTAPITMVGATINVVAKGGVVFATPVIMYSVLSLIRPWIPGRLWRALLYLMVATVLGYLFGIVFVYYVMLPIGLGFLLSFGAGIAVAVIDIGEYLKFLTALMSAMGIVFQIPIWMFMLAKLKLVRYRHFKFGRYFVPLFAGFLGIILTPTVDGMNFMMVSVPVLLLYEVGMFSAWVIDREDGNYLFLNTIGRWLGKVRAGVVWVVRRPVVMARWGYRWVYRFFR